MDVMCFVVRRMLKTSFRMFYFAFVFLRVGVLGMGGFKNVSVINV